MIMALLCALPLLAAGQARPQLSVVVPMFNEAANLEPLVARLTPVLERCADSFEVIFVDDGSSDDTLGALRAVHRLDLRCAAGNPRGDADATARTPVQRAQTSLHKSIIGGDGAQPFAAGSTQDMTKASILLPLFTYRTGA